MANDIAAMSFEEALAELETIVRQLENGQGKLDDSIQAYERGAELKKHCETKLKEAKAKVEKISLNADGVATAQPVDVE
ncbi:MAG: exodeoxyribonuclease VII small subunit [Rhodospirillales bacterium]|nr:exodeoxyribonuclease VII small subunit [Rhodospirillales bacterium]